MHISRKEWLAISLGVVAVAALSGVLFVQQKEQWKEQYAMGDVRVVGSRRIELTSPEGKAFFAELSPETQVYEGTSAVHPGQLPAGAGVVVFGKWRGPERIEADVVRVVAE